MLYEYTRRVHAKSDTRYATVKFWYLSWRTNGHEWWVTKSTGFCNDDRL